MISKPCTPAEYEQAVEICRTVNRRDNFRHKKNGSLVCVTSVYAVLPRPFICLMMISARAGRQNYTVDALNFAKLYETA